MKIKFKNGSVEKEKKKKASVPKKVKKSQVIRTLSTMDKEKTEPTQQQSADTTTAGSGSATDQASFHDEFYTSGRIGRRNAMPDILGNNCTASAGGDLPLKLSALTTNESTSSQATNVTDTPNQTNK